MCADDPSLVDTATLLKSIRTSVAEASARLQEAVHLLQIAQVAAWEIERRAATALPASPTKGPVATP